MTTIPTTTEIQHDRVISEERLEWLRERSGHYWNKRNTYSVEIDCNTWHKLVVNKHQAVWNKLGGSRRDILVDLGSLTDKEIYLLLEETNGGKYTEVVQEIRHLVQITKIGDVGSKLYNELNESEEWILSGKLKSGIKAGKAINRTFSNFLKKLDKDPSYQYTCCLSLSSPLPPDVLRERVDVLRERIKACNSLGLSQLGDLRSDIKAMKNNDSGLTVAIVAEPHHFLRLGSHSGVDTGSCFKSGGQYQFAPFVIGLHDRSVVYYVKRGKQVIGRAWGAIYPDCAIVSNVYPNTDTSAKAVTNLLIHKSLEQLYSTLWGDRLRSRGHTVRGSSLVYHNGDCVAYVPDHSDFSAPSFHLCHEGYIRDSEEDCLGSCRECGDTLFEGDSYEYVHEEFYCGDCVRSLFAYVNSIDEYVPRDETCFDEINIEAILCDDAVTLACGTTTHRHEARYCRHDGEYYRYHECVQLATGDYAHREQARETYDNDYYLIDDTVYMAWGIHEGEHAHIDDPDLETDYHGDYGISGDDDDD